jgi:hypothetical protein
MLYTATADACGLRLAPVFGARSFVVVHPVVWHIGVETRK